MGAQRSETFKITNHIGAESFDLPIYISTTGKTHKEISVDWSKNEKCFIVYSEKGCGKALINGEWVPLPEGTLIYFPTKSPVIYEPFDENIWSTAFITFGGRQAESLAGDRVIILKNEEFSFFPELIGSFLERHGKKDWDEYSQGALYYLLVKLRRLANTVDQSSRTDFSLHKKMLDSIKYINEHYSGDISLSEQAASCCISEEYYCKLFKELTGATLTSYVNSARVAHACDLLTNKLEMKIDEVGRLCGFSSPTYFCKVFKKEIGVTPGEFRKSRV